MKQQSSSVITSKLEITRRFFPYGFGAEYTMQVALPAFAISELIERMIHQLFSNSVFEQQSIPDLKGRDASIVLDTSVNESERPHGEELLYVLGNVLPGERDDGQKNGPEEKLEFEIRLQTAFKEFLGNSVIHSLHEERKGALPSFIPLKKIGRIFPVEITRFRLGMDIFEPRLSTYMLGASASVTHSIFLECTPSTLHLLFTVDGLKSRQESPFTTKPNLGLLAHVLKEVLHINVEDDYKCLAEKRAG